MGKYYICYANYNDMMHYSTVHCPLNKHDYNIGQPPKIHDFTLPYLKLDHRLDVFEA